VRVTFNLWGEPKGQGRHRSYNTKQGVRVNVDPSAKEKANIGMVVQGYADKLDRMLEGPIMASFIYWHKRPKNHYRTGKFSDKLKATAPKVKASMPDLDNLDKLLMDAMQGILFKDDKQIVIKWSGKFYNKRPGTSVILEELDGDSQEQYTFEVREMRDAIRGEMKAETEKEKRRGSGSPEINGRCDERFAERVGSRVIAGTIDRDET